jgi:L-amino acid N-acyltransferase YncA
VQPGSPSPEAPTGGAIAKKVGKESRLFRRGRIRICGFQKRQYFRKQAHLSHHDPQALFAPEGVRHVHPRLLDVTPTAPMSECLVRAAAPVDIAAVTAIYAHFVETSTATFDLVAPAEATMLRKRQVVLDHGLPYLIAELEGYIKGYSYAAPFRPRKGYRFTVEDSIYVRADCKGHGVGKRLLNELILNCQTRSRHSMVACVCGINLPSVALHASLGFVPIGTLPEAGKKFGKWLSLSIMQRLL